MATPTRKKTKPDLVRYVAGLRELRSLGFEQVRKNTCPVCLATFTKESYRNVCMDWHKGKGR